MSNVFEAMNTVKQWDDDYYPPLALKLYDRAIADMLELMDVGENSTVLDAGCGPGVHSIRVAKAGHRVVAIDLSEEMLRQARERVATNGLSNRVEFAQKDLTKLDYPDASFRHVFSWGVIIHIPTAEKALDELARIVEPGGKLALYVTNKSALDHKLESFARLIFRKPVEQLKRLPLGDGLVYPLSGQKLWVWRFDARALTTYLEAQGFRLVHRRIGELTEHQRRTSGLLRNLLLRLNNLAYCLKFPVDWGNGQMLVFEKAER